MAVTFDAFSAGPQTQTIGGPSWTHPVGANANLLTVEVGGYYPFVGIANLTVNQVFVNGNIQMTLLAQLNNNNTPGYGWTQLWVLQNPPKGQSVTIAVQEDDGLTGMYLEVCAASYNGVTQLGTPVINWGSTASVSSGAIVSQSGGMVLNVVGSAAGTLTPASGSTVRYHPTAVSSYTTLLVQDKAGAASVSQNSGYSGSNGWATISVNMVGGNNWTSKAIGSYTASTSAKASFVGTVHSSRAFTTLTATAQAGGLVTVLGSPLRYVGRWPDTDSTVIPVAYARADNAATVVTPTWITQQVNSAAANLVTQAWVQGQIANYQSQAQITTALGNYVPTSALGTTVAQSDTSNNVPAAQLPTGYPITNSIAKCYDLSSPGASQLVLANQTVISTTHNINDVLLAQISVPDPGYPWIALPFAYVRAAAGGISNLLTAGTGNFGALTVIIQGTPTVFYGVGICTDDPTPNYYPLVPASSTNPTGGVQTPLTSPPLPATTRAGETVFQLGGCNLSTVANSNNYLFSGANLQFYILVLPAVHS